METSADCELIPNQTYKLSGSLLTRIQPEVSEPPPPRQTDRRGAPPFPKAVFLFLFQSSKFVNFNDYNNFLASFQVQLPDDMASIELQLKTCTTGWLFRSTDTVVWHRVVQLPAQPG